MNPDLMKLTANLVFASTAMVEAETKPSVLRQSIAHRAVDRYHGMIEAMGARYSPELWNARNALDNKWE